MTKACPRSEGQVKDKAATYDGARTQYTGATRISRERRSWCLLALPTRAASTSQRDAQERGIVEDSKGTS